MRRGVHIAVAVLALIVLVRPFDCFSGGKFDRKAADCCKKGKCTPSNSDDCCKATVPGGNQLVSVDEPDHSSPTLDVIATEVPDTTLRLSAMTRFIEINQPPGSPPDLNRNLPLLI